MLFLNLSSQLALMVVCASILAAGGWTAVDLVILVCFALVCFGPVVGSWHAIVGWWLLRWRTDPEREVAPFVAAGRTAVPVVVRTAILLFLRNEDVARAILRLQVVKRSVDATGHGARFDYFVLSDTNRPELWEEERATVASWQQDLTDGGSQVIYRRRDVNTGYKAGNVRDFCERWGSDYELMIPLDADSLMSGEAVVGLVRMMQTYPEIGIIQSQVVGLTPSTAFARLSQYGSRSGRPNTYGLLWRVGDCASFWGHNAVVRVKPFTDHCRLPLIPGPPPLGGPVMSHDHVEAALMTRAGFEVRMLPDLQESWEDLPPTILDFATRDARWCQGNLQYFGLVSMPDLRPMSRVSLLWTAIITSFTPASVVLVGLLPVAAWQAQGEPDFPTSRAIGLFLVVLLLSHLPRLIGMVDVLFTPRAVTRLGGPATYLASTALELVFTMLLAPVLWFGVTWFMAGLLVGRAVNWGGQSRDSYALGWGAAAAKLWPHTLFGLTVCGALLAIAPPLFWWSLPVTAGCVLAIPLAVITSGPALTQAMERAGLCAIPEERDPSPEVLAVRGHRVADPGVKLDRRVHAQ